MKLWLAIQYPSLLMLVNIKPKLYPYDNTMNPFVKMKKKLALKMSDFLSHLVRFLLFPEDPIVSNWSLKAFSSVIYISFFQVLLLKYCVYVFLRDYFSSQWTIVSYKSQFSLIDELPMLKQTKSWGFSNFKHERSAWDRELKESWSFTSRIFSWMHIVNITTFLVA